MAQHVAFNDFGLSLRTVRSYAPPQDRCGAMLMTVLSTSK
jgi:hypothetical protein